jgi:hypothetical protein
MRPVMPGSRVAPLGLVGSDVCQCLESAQAAMEDVDVCTATDAVQRLGFHDVIASEHDILDGIALSAADASGDAG